MPSKQVSLRIPKEPDAAAMAKGIIKTFPRRLNKAGVKPEQVERLVRRMIDKCEVERSRRNSEESTLPSQSPGAGVGEAAGNGGGGDDADIFSEDVDLNAVSPEKLQVRNDVSASVGTLRSRGDVGGVWWGVQEASRSPQQSCRLNQFIGSYSLSKQKTCTISTVKKKEEERKWESTGNGD